jgi:hypothetical protein
LRWYGRAAVSADHEDVANVALNSAIRQLQGGRYPGIVDRESLWRMLARFAICKAGRIVRQWQRRPAVRPISAMSDPVNPSTSPSSRLASAEERERLIDALRAYRPQKSQHPRGEELVQLVHLLAEGHDVPEIA